MPVFLLISSVLVAIEPSVTLDVVSLGETLFFDVGLSSNGRVSCSSCHLPDRAFADVEATSQGVNGAFGTRNTPSLLNFVEGQLLFWDGRRGELETLITDPLLNPREHGVADANTVVDYVSANHMGRHERAFPGRAVSIESVQLSIASFIRTLDRGTSMFDKYLAGDLNALDRRQKMGLNLFRGIAQCTRCHPIDAGFSDGKFHFGQSRSVKAQELGDIAQLVGGLPPEDRYELIARDARVEALGRFVVTLEPSDISHYKTPSLRNVALTAPYMHDGGVETLREAVERELYWREDGSRRLTTLTPDDRANIVKFLEALSSERSESSVYSRSDERKKFASKDSL